MGARFLRLGDLLYGLPARLIAGDETTEIIAITPDSREARPGVMFAAIPGAKLDGANFIADAVRRGAPAVLAAPGAPIAGALAIEAADPRSVLAHCAARLAGSLPRVIAAVTGTNGKTSTVDFLRQIWLAADIPAASIGTLGVVTAHSATKPGLTTPDPVTLANTLAGLVSQAIDYVALEASSHGLDQKRLDGLKLAAGGFTNLTRDHLDYHANMQAYAAAKLRLFSELLPDDASVVANTALTEPTMSQLRAIATGRAMIFETVGVGGTLINLKRVTPFAHGQSLELETIDGPVEVLLPLAGRYQVDNALLAAGLAITLLTQNVLHALLTLKGVRGRLEMVDRLSKGGAAYVDYAHTPDALTNLLQSLRPHCAGRLILVFGAGGDRDPGKRPLMGEVAETLADIAIITDDNPRGEDPKSIRDAIRAGCPKALEFGDRRQAIAEALEMAGHEDIVVVAGKGHEQGQIVGGETLPFDDASVIRELLGAA